MVHDIADQAAATTPADPSPDRGKLAYLNGVEKANCTYCSYANGLVAYVREIAARTEQ